jgi:hypothetical protein
MKAQKIGEDSQIDRDRLPIGMYCWAARAADGAHGDTTGRRRAVVISTGVAQRRFSI